MEVDEVVDLGLLVLRLVTGPLLAGHGSQKLFGAFGGHGLEGTAGWLNSMGLRPSKAWASMAGLSEFAGGVLTALGLFHPLGSIFMMGPMSVAIGRVHWGKPIWVTEGGAELPVTNTAVAVGLAVSGPGRYSLDNVFGIRVPFPIVLLTLAATVAGIGVGLSDELRTRLAEVPEQVASIAGTAESETPAESGASPSIR
ncbi:MAG TPA: DoxX family protein [Chloroflexota bacterium]